MRKWLLFVVLFSGVFLAIPLRAQQAVPPIAAITDGNVWLVNLNGGRQPITTTGGYDDPFWNADGSLLGFTGDSPGGGRTLFVSDLTDRPLTQLASGLAPLFPAGFSPDGSQLVYALAGGSSLIEVYRFAPQAGASPTLLGTFQYNGSCSSGSGAQLPNESHFNFDSRDRFGGSGHDGVLALTSFGLLHDSSCARLDLYLMTPQTGRDVRLFSAADAVFVSPEQARVVVRTGSTLSFVNSEQGPYTQIQPADTPDQVGFGLPGSSEIFYSTRKATGPTPLPAGMADVLGGIFFQMPTSYEVSLHRFSLRTGIDDTLYTASAFGIGRIALTADGGTVIFSQTPNPDAWVQALADKRLTTADLTTGAGAFAQTEIYALALADKSVVRLGQNIAQMALNPQASMAGAVVPTPAWTPLPTLPIPPTPTYPPTLTPLPPGGSRPTETPVGSGLAIGVHATINADMTSLNVRRQPGTGSRVVEILHGGEKVFIIDGPKADAEGYTWWHVTLESGADGWIAESIGGVPTMER